METRFKKSLASTPGGKTLKSKKSPSPERSLRKSVRSGTGPLEKEANVSSSLSTSTKSDVPANVTRRVARTRRVSGMSNEASPVRITRSTKILLPQETLSESSDTPNSPTPLTEKDMDPSTPRARKLIIESADESGNESGETRSRLKTSRNEGANGKAAMTLSLSTKSSKRSGSNSGMKEDGKTSLIMSSPKVSGNSSPVGGFLVRSSNRLKEAPSPEVNDLKKSPERVVASSTRRSSKNAPKMAEDESEDPSSPSLYEKIVPRKSPEKTAPGSPRTRRLSLKSPMVAGVPRELTTSIPSEDGSFEKNSPRKSAERTIPGSPGTRRSPVKSPNPADICGKLIMNLPSEDESKEPSSAVSPKECSPGKLPEKTIQRSPRTRRSSGKSPNSTRVPGKLTVDLPSGGDSIATSSVVSSKSDKSRKSPDKTAPGSPKMHRISEKSPRNAVDSHSKFTLALSSEDESNLLAVMPSKTDSSTKSLESANARSSRTRSSFKKSDGDELSEKEITVVSSGDEPIESLNVLKNKEIAKNTRGKAARTPTGRNTSNKSSEDGKLEEPMEVSSDDGDLVESTPATSKATKLLENPSEAIPAMVVSSDEHPEDSLILSKTPQRKSSEPSSKETPRQRLLSAVQVENEVSNGFSKKMSISDGSEGTPVSNPSKKKDQKRKSLEKSSSGTLRPCNVSSTNEMDVSFGSQGKDSANLKVRDKQVSDLSASMADVSLNSKNARNRRKKHKKQHKKGGPLQRKDDDVRKKDTSSRVDDSGVTVRRRGGGTIIESRPVFSDDAKYVYLNCGWGVRVFSVETGECVRVFDALSKDFKVVTCFCWNSFPAALTSEGVFIAWDPRSGRIHHKVRMHVTTTEMVVDGFFMPSDDPSPHLCLVIESADRTNLRLYSGSNFRSSTHPLNARKVDHPYKLHSLSVGGDPKHPFIAFIEHDKGIKVVNLQNKCFFRNSNPQGIYWTCIRAHPAEDTVAVGDSIGRIVVFRNLKHSRPGNNRSIHSTYHWHTLPVGEIAFTPAGSSMYSGGGELTLVKWNLENPHVKNFLPRLSAEIVHISISPYNQMIAVATLDNGVQIVTPTSKLQCVLQQLSWSVIVTEQERMFPSGLVYDSRSRGLILNSRPGHLQLYSPHSETLTYNIDVTMMNYLTQERNKVIVNTQVTHSALTSDGLWLATIETRYEPGLTLELRLKFWSYSNEKKRFILATVIDMPHDDQVHTIKFSPEPSSRVSNESIKSLLDVVLVSTGADKKMRLWSKTAIDSIYRKGETWRCQNACFYRDQPCGPCSFSFDGSLLAVGFGAALTLWDVENVVLKQSLSRGTETIKFVEFGQTDCCSMLMCATESTVVAWDLLKLVVSWKVDMKSAIFVADPYSSFVAVFTVDNQWKILNAHCGEVVYTMNSEGKSEMSDRPQKQQVLAAVFTPRHRPNTEAPMWMRNSYLYYLDVYQELNCLEPANEITQLPKFQLAADKDNGTLFGSLVGAKTVRELADKERETSTAGYGVLGVQAITQLLRPAAHSLPPVRLLCGSLLQSFVIIKRDGHPPESDRDDKSEDDKTTVIASSDSEHEVEMPTFAAPSSRPKKSTRSPKTDRKPLTAPPSDSTPEPMETDGVDLRKHFPMLDEDTDAPWRPLLRQTDTSELFVVEE